MLSSPRHCLLGRSRSSRMRRGHRWVQQGPHCGKYGLVSAVSGSRGRRQHQASAAGTKARATRLAGLAEGTFWKVVRACGAERAGRLSLRKPGPAETVVGRWRSRDVLKRWQLPKERAETHSRKEYGVEWLCGGRLKNAPAGSKRPREKDEQA